MKIEKLFAGLNISAWGMSAQRKRMNAIASNIANAETTRTEDGTPYRRKIVSMQSGEAQALEVAIAQSSGVRMTTTQQGHLAGGDAAFREVQSVPGSVEAQESVDMSDYKLVHDPTHPDADENGYVKMPNVNIVTEMVDMMSASRAYEANITVLNAQKAMAKDTLEI
jgi:flagellar basal-body rod protein FlgC